MEELRPAVVGVFARRPLAEGSGRHQGEVDGPQFLGRRLWVLQLDEVRILAEHVPHFAVPGAGELLKHVLQGRADLGQGQALVGGAPDDVDDHGGRGVGREGCSASRHCLQSKENC